MVRKIVLAGMALCLAPWMAHATILVNGDFEDGDTGQITNTPIPGWQTYNFNGWHHDDAGKTIDDKAMKLWWIDSGVYQDFAAVEGQQYDFSVQCLNASDDPLVNLNFVIKAEFYDSGVGTDPVDALANVELDRYYSATDLVDEWVEIGGSIVAPAGADIGRIVFALVDFVDPSGGSMNFDNAVVTPEPASLALLGLGGIMLLRRRRA